ncbi:unnamed protein product [Strongylus vulgaris]|uniref:Uncharacterized protein n=1 Tax=Strongylus vulgaris TaxID=40348 RepID=A0A3P7IYQ4_STRVU|nr:unnamed protein product [Strongylus vulgaris]
MEKKVDSKLFLIDGRGSLINEPTHGKELYGPHREDELSEAWRWQFVRSRIRRQETSGSPSADGADLVRMAGDHIGADLPMEERDMVGEHTDAEPNEGRGPSGPQYGGEPFTFGSEHPLGPRSDERRAPGPPPDDGF